MDGTRDGPFTRRLILTRENSLEDGGGKSIKGGAVDGLSSSSSSSSFLSFKQLATPQVLSIVIYP